MSIETPPWKFGRDKLFHISGCLDSGTEMGTTNAKLTLLRLEHGA
ncbi:MAG: hypothetical protein ACLQNE_04015 [Thermoguttaceae bacterium]